MNKEELILDIVEKTHDKIESLVEVVQEMKIEQTKQNMIVAEHERRSTASEKRLYILEKDAQFFKNFIKTVTIISGVVLFLVKVLPSLLHL